MNEKELLRTAPREQLNKFIDDLRKELVLNRMHLSEANRQVKAIMNRLNDSEKNAEIMRQHLIKREESESNLRKEFEKHLLFKDAEIKNLRHIVIEKSEYSKDFAEKLYKQLLAHETDSQKITEELLAKNKDSDISFNRLVAQLREKDKAIEKLSFHNSELLKKIELYNAENIPKSADKGLSAELKKEVLRLSAVNSELESFNHNLSFELEAQLRRKNGELEKLRKLLGSKEVMIERLSAEYSRQIAGLGAAEKNKGAEERIKGISKEFSDKEFAFQSELEKAKQNYSELELLNRSVSFELEAQLRRKDGELEKFRKLLSSKEVMIERLSAEYSKQVNEKDRQIAELNNLIKRNISEITYAEKYKNLLSIAKEANKKLLQEHKSISKELSDYKLVVEEKDAILKEEAKRFQEFASEINKRTEERIKDIVKEFSSKEVAVKVELESTRQKLIEQEKTLSAKQREIDEALDNFALVSQKVLSFKNPEALQMFRENELRELEKQINAKSEMLSAKEMELKAVLEDIQSKEKKLSEKELQITSFLKNLEERTNALAQAEEELKGKEELLVMQQQAFQKELAMLEDIGFEFKEVKPRKLEEINAALKLLPKQKQLKTKQKATLKAIKVLKPRTIPIPILRQRLEKPELPELQQPKQEYISEKPAILPKPEVMAEIKAEKLTPHEELFGKDREGFSEMDEIRSVIEVAREHGDSDEAIMSSLVSSGYSKEKVEQALKNVRIAKQF